MGSAVQRLTALVSAPDRFDIPWSELRDRQVEAVNERLQDALGRVKLLAQRARDGGVTQVTKLDDIVPLLFAHTTYKSYPEAWLIEQRWDRMTKWLETVSARPIAGVDLADVKNIDDWIERLGRAGHFVSCSSGTTGKSAMLNASPADMEWAKRETVAAVCWGTGLTPAQDRRIFGLSPVASVPRNLTVQSAFVEAFGRPDASPFRYPVPPITIGQITGMVALRKSMADGSATPGDIAAYERVSAERQKAVDDAVGITADALIEARADKLFLSGMWASLYKICQDIRAKGFVGQDFNAQNTLYVGGGLKGAVLPPDYREFVYETLNVAPERVFQMYGMQEINSTLPRCRAGRYHAPPWLICLPLDAEGESLLPLEGEVEGRAGFFDLALEGRWGGVISGDKISIQFGRCDCGHQGPSILDEITRYADLPGGDKISCSGTIDAYVRGAT